MEDVEAVLQPVLLRAGRESPTRTPDAGPLQLVAEVLFRFESDPVRVGGVGEHPETVLSPICWARFKSYLLGYPAPDREARLKEHL